MKHEQTVKCKHITSYVIIQYVNIVMSFWGALSFGNFNCVQMDRCMYGTSLIDIALSLIAVAMRDILRSLYTYIYSFMLTLMRAHACFIPFQLQLNRLQQHYDCFFWMRLKQISSLRRPLDNDDTAFIITLGCCCRSSLQVLHIQVIEEQGRNPCKDGYGADQEE
eukprot:999031-Amphidinium_carterae.1